MAGKFPYVASAGPLVKAITQLRKSFPKEVTAETLKKLGIAPNNESYVITTLRFLKIIDSEGKKIEAAGKIFSNHDDAAFTKEFESLVHAAYHELFDLQGDDAWQLEKGPLTQFFRTSDQSSDIVGQRQAVTFKGLAALSGHGEIPEAKAVNSQTPKAEKKAPKAAKAAKSVAPAASTQASKNTFSGDLFNKSAVGLTVRIEVNLPAGADQTTYDAIFQSIRRNLIDS